jgi:gas vesicle structural protein
MSTMAMQGRGGGGGYAQRSGSSGLYDVLDLLLDKGLVIDVYLRVSLVGIELLTIDARIVIASVDTYLRFAEAVNRLDLGTAEGQGLPDLVEDVTSGGAQSKTKGILEGAKESLFGSGDEEEEQQGAEPQSRGSSRSSGGSSRSAGSSRRSSGLSSRSSGSSSRSPSQRSGSRSRPSTSSRDRQS